MPEASTSAPTPSTTGSTSTAAYSLAIEQQWRATIELSDVPIPGLVRGSGGTITDDSVLRGFHRIAVTGPDTSNWEVTLRYMNTVARVIAADREGTVLPGLHRHTIHYIGDVDNVEDVREHLRVMSVEAEGELINPESATIYDDEGLAVRNAVIAWRDSVVLEYDLHAQENQM